MCLTRSPTAPLLAVGTMAGAIDLSVSTTACLEARACASRSHAASPAPDAGVAQVYRLDLDADKRDLPLAGGAVATTERFHRLAWSPSGTETGELPVRRRRLASRSCAPG